MTFELWMKNVEAFVSQNAQLSVYDLPDRNFYDQWENGSTPADAGEDALENAGFEFK